MYNDKLKTMYMELSFCFIVLIVSVLCVLFLCRKRGRLLFGGFKRGRLNRRWGR